MGELERENEALRDAYRELEEKYIERGQSMRDTAEIVRSLYVPYLHRIKKALKMADDLDALMAIAKAIKELEAHTPIGDVDEN